MYATVKVYRAIKAFCPDFRPIRKVLRELGATPLGRKAQTDYFFHLPDSPNKSTSRRLKLRVEAGRPCLLYHYDRHSTKSRLASFKVLELNDAVGARRLFESVLGVEKVVKKQREAWAKGKTRVHLDRIEGVGRVFEVESEGGNSGRWKEESARYRRLFGPYLGAEITGSNEDLVSQEAAAATTAPTGARGSKMTDAAITLADLRTAVIAFRDERDWARFHTPKNLTTAVATEAAELAELYLWQGDADRPTDERVERTAQEMADVLIYLLCLADALKIDLALAVKAKLAKNAERYPADAVRGSVEKYSEYKREPRG